MPGKLLDHVPRQGLCALLLHCCCIAAQDTPWELNSPTAHTFHSTLYHWEGGNCICSSWNSAGGYSLGITCFSQSPKLWHHKSVALTRPGWPIWGTSYRGFSRRCCILNPNHNSWASSLCPVHTGGSEPGSLLAKTNQAVTGSLYSSWR